MRQQAQLVDLVEIIALVARIAVRDELGDEIRVDFGLVEYPFVGRSQLGQSHRKETFNKTYVPFALPAL